MKSNKLFHTVMKAKNIIYIISLMLAAISCSMEDDTLMNDATKGIENSLNGEEIALAFSLTNGEVATKATDNTTDQDLNNVTVFLLKNGTVVNAERFATKAEAEANIFYIKKDDSTWKMIVVANADVSITGLSDAASIHSATASLADKTKFGEATLDIAGMTGKEYVADIELRQSYAKVGLASFKVQRNGSTGYNNLKVELTKVALINQNTKGRIDGSALIPEVNELANPNRTCTDYILLNNDTNPTELLSNPIFFNTFAYEYKEASNKQSVELTYKVNGISHTETIQINGNDGSVEAGNIYKLNVTASVSPEGIVTILNVNFEVVNLVEREINPEAFC